MSTTYAIFKDKIPVDGDGNIQAEYDSTDYVIIGRTHGFTTEGAVLAKYLKANTPVYALDNDTHIKNIKQLIKYYNTK